VVEEGDVTAGRQPQLVAVLDLALMPSMPASALAPGFTDRCRGQVEGVWPARRADLAQAALETAGPTADRQSQPKLRGNHRPRRASIG
jgi:hypothetical protein